MSLTVIDSSGDEDLIDGRYGLLYQICADTAGKQPHPGDSRHALLCKIVENTGGHIAHWDGIYDLYWKFAENTAGARPKFGDNVIDLLYKITSNVGGTPKFGDGICDLLRKVCENMDSHGSPQDPDAQAFIARAGITDATQIGAVNNLVIALKSIVWPKIRALYPFVGGTQLAHSQNLKGPAFTIAWNGEYDDANGATGSPSTKGDTGLNATSFTVGSVAFGVYNISGGTDEASEISAYQSGNDFSLTAMWTDNTTYGSMGTSNNSVSVTGYDPRGFWLLNNSSLEPSNNLTFYREGIPVTGKNITSGAAPNLPYLLLYGCSRTIATAFFSDGLSRSEISSLTSAVTVFQAALGRKV